MALWVEIAKFLAGFIAADLIAHASFLVSKVEPKVIGIRFTSNVNKTIIVFDFIALVILIYMGWFGGF